MTLYNNDNGILSTVPGAFVAAALATLPDPSNVNADSVNTIIDVPALGQVRFTCRRSTARKGKSVSQFWVAEKAEQVGGA